jgi:hypothetical protein
MRDTRSRRLLTPPPGTHITLQRPPGIPQSTAIGAAQSESVPKPSPQKKRRYLASVRSTSSSKLGVPSHPSNQASTSEDVQGLTGVFAETERNIFDDEVSHGEFGMAEDVMESEPHYVDGTPPLPDPIAPPDTYEIFAEAVMTEAIPFFQLAPELYVVTGWDSRMGKRTVSGDS